MFFPKEHRKKMQESTFRPLLHRFCFLHLSITQKERAYWLKRNKLIGPSLTLCSPDRRKRGKRIQYTRSARANTVAVHILNGRTMTAQNVLHPDFCMKKHIQSRDRLYCLCQTVINSITLAATLMPSSFWTPAEYIRLAP